MVCKCSGKEYCSVRGHRYTGMPSRAMKQPLIMEHNHWEYSRSPLESIIFTDCIHSALVCFSPGELHQNTCDRSSTLSHIEHLGIFQITFACAPFIVDRLEYRKGLAKFSLAIDSLSRSQDTQSNNSSDSAICLIRNLL